MTGKIALYAGSFDPPTNGHMWVIERAAEKFEKVYVSIGLNTGKRTRRFDIGESLEILSSITGHLDNIEISTFTDLYQADYADMISAKYIIRGVRSTSDFSYESDIRYVTSEINSDLETEFLIPPKELIQISSSIVMGLIGFDGWEDVVENMVPKEVFTRLIKLEEQRDENFLREALRSLVSPTDLDLIIYRYSGKDRFYHGLKHITRGLKEIHKCSHLLQNPDLVKVAWLIHDLVNDPLSGTNEEDSLQFAEEKCKLIHHRNRPKVTTLVLATAHDEAPSDSDSQYITDVDLSSLGKSYRLFERNTRLVYQEYKDIVSLEDFCKGRAKLLTQFATRKGGLYSTEFFRDLYLDSALRNIARFVGSIRL